MKTYMLCNKAQKPCPISDEHSAVLTRLPWALPVKEVRHFISINGFNILRWATKIIFNKLVTSVYFWLGLSRCFVKQTSSEADLLIVNCSCHVSGRRDAAVTVHAWWDLVLVFLSGPEKACALWRVCCNVQVALAAWMLKTYDSLCLLETSFHLVCSV